jgi:hypothetical protein
VQLDFLLGQTQKYSSMLAERLVGEDAAAAASQHPLAQQAAQRQPEEGSGAAGREPPSRQQGPGLAPGAAAPSSQAASGIEGSTAADGDGRGGEEEEGDEYVSGQDDDADDEGTLEEEERLAAAEAGGEPVVAAAEKAEAAGLADDAELPLEQLLARYGYVVPGEGDEVMAEAEASQGCTGSDDAGEAGGARWRPGCAWLGLNIEQLKRASGSWTNVCFYGRDCRAQGWMLGLWLPGKARML